MNIKIYALISARSGSKSIPKKNIKLLGGHPLIAYTIAASELSKKIERTVVTTDSEEIAEISKRYGASIPFLRPSEISHDNSLDIEFFQHYINFFKKNSMIVPDLIVHLRPTSPLRQINIIDKAIEYMIENKEATALRSMSNTHLTPYKMFKLKGEYARPFLEYGKNREFYNLPRQIFEDAYIPNGYVDIIRPKVLQETGLLHGAKIKLFETEKIPDIDVISDFEYAEKILGKKKFLQIRNYLEEINGKLS